MDTCFEFGKVLLAHPVFECGKYGLHGVWLHAGALGNLRGRLVFAQEKIKDLGLLGREAGAELTLNFRIIQANHHAVA